MGNSFFIDENGQTVYPLFDEDGNYRQHELMDDGARIFEYPIPLEEPYYFNRDWKILMHSLRGGL